MTAAEWINRQRQLSNCARDSRLALDALEKALELADKWTARGEHLMAYSKTVPEEVATPLLEAGADFVEKARILRHTIADTLEIKP